MAALRDGTAASCSRLPLLLRSVLGYLSLTGRRSEKSEEAVYQHISHYTAHHERRLPRFLLSSEAKSSGGFWRLKTDVAKHLERVRLRVELSGGYWTMISSPETDKKSWRFSTRSFSRHPFVTKKKKTQTMRRSVGHVCQVWLLAPVSVGGPLC